MMALTPTTEENKKNKRLYSLIALLILLLIAQTVAIIYFMAKKEKPNAKNTPTLETIHPNAYQPVYPRFNASAARPQTPLRPQWDHDFFADPFAAFQQMEDRMNRLFGSFPAASSFVGAFIPSIDLEETADAYIVRSDLPGLEKDKINITVEDHLLTIQGVREETFTSEDQKSGYYAQERNYGSFARSVNLPGPVEESQIAAKYEEGVLTVTLPKLKGAEEKSKIVVQ